MDLEGKDFLQMAILSDSVLLRNIVWEDAELKHFYVDYDAVTLLVSEANAQERLLRCEGHLSVSMIGFWDELIVAEAQVYATHPAIDAALAALEKRLGTGRDASGNAARNRGGWQCLIVRFGDGCELTVVAAEFHVSDGVRTIS